MKQIKHKETRKVLYEYEEGKLNFNGANLKGADFSCANLEGADFSCANLKGADFWGANLEGADFWGANLEGANFKGANLRFSIFGQAVAENAVFRGANLSHASMIFAHLVWANMADAVLIGTDFTDADLRYCQFWRADMTGASMTGAVIYDASLRNAFNVPYIPMGCPETGSFTAWKRVDMYIGVEVKAYIVELEIPADAKRSSATTRKCRASKALVKSISRVEDGKVRACPDTMIVNNAYGVATVYEVGEMTYPDKFNDNRWDECSNGIHFFINKQDAIDYRP